LRGFPQADALQAGGLPQVRSGKDVKGGWSPAQLRRLADLIKSDGMGVLDALAAIAKEGSP
jgi:hypothetical protein